MDDEGVHLGRGLHIAHLNIRSLLGGHAFDMTKQQIMSSGIDVFTLSETWLTEAIPDKTIGFEGFNVIRKDRTWKENVESDVPKKGGGHRMLCKGKY